MKNKLVSMLAECEDGQKILVEMKDGRKYVLYDFQIVDESIYKRSDLVVATVGEILNSQFPFRIGTLIEISVLDIVSMVDTKTEAVVFAI